MRVQEILDYAFVQTGLARVGEIPTDQWTHALTSLNIAYKKVWQMFPWQAQKKIEVSVTSVLGSVTLPNTIDNVRAVRIEETPLAPIDEALFSRFDPGGLSRTAAIYGYMWGEPQPVLTQPSSAVNVRIKSSSTSDTSGTVRVYGIVGGVDDYEDFTLNGTSNVDGSKSFTEITRIMKPTTVGRVTVLDTSNNEFGTIAPWHQQPEYQQLLLVPTPDENKTVTIQALRRFQPLQDANDAIEPAMLEPAVIHMLQSLLYMRAKAPALAAQEKQDAADAILIAAGRENEINDKDWHIAPDHGMFGDLGTADDRGSGWPWYATY